MASGKAFNPTTGSVIRRAFTEHVRSCSIMTAICLTAWNPYIVLVTWAQAAGWTERILVCVGISVVHCCIYWCMNSFFMLCDRRRWLEEYKLERTEAMGPSEELVKHTLFEAAISQFVLGPIVLLFVVHPVATTFGMPALTTVLPPVHRLFLWFLGSMVFNDWVFYAAHRAFHHRRIYKHVHKKHHFYKGSIGFAGEHAHFIEEVLANQLPAAASFLFGGAHFLIFLVYLGCRLESVYEGHSGYCFYGTWLHKLGLTYAEQTAYHDFHHTKNSGNFAAPYLDYFFGTMDAWIEVGGVEGYLALKRQGVVGNVLNNIHPTQSARIARKEHQK